MVYYCYTMVMLWLLCQPGEAVLWLLCHPGKNQCVCVLTAPWVFFQPFSLCLAYPRFNKQCEQQDNWHHKQDQWYIYTHTYTYMIFLRFISIIGYYKIMSINPWVPDLLYFTWEVVRKTLYSNKCADMPGYTERTSNKRWKMKPTENKTKTGFLQEYLGLVWSTNLLHTKYA